MRQPPACWTAAGAGAPQVGERAAGAATGPAQVRAQAARGPEPCQPGSRAEEDIFLIPLSGPDLKPPLALEAAASYEGTRVGGLGGEGHNRTRRFPRSFLPAT